MAGFVLIMTDYVLDFTGVVLILTGFILNMTGFDDDNDDDQWNVMAYMTVSLVLYS